MTATAGQKSTRWRARTKYRDTDGVLRDVERFGTTKAKAETRLRVALAERTSPRGGNVLRADMLLVDAGELWLEGRVERPDSGLAVSTQVQYRDGFQRYVRGSRIGGLTLREANRVPVLEGWLQATADQHGTGAAKTARSVVSSIIGLAVRYQVLDFNASRDVRPAKAKTPKATKRDTKRALTRKERDAFLKVVDASETASHAQLDVADIAWFMAGTGVRISEALGQHWNDVVLSRGTVFVRSCVRQSGVRVPVSVSL